MILRFPNPGRPGGKFLAQMHHAIDELRKLSYRLGVPGGTTREDDPVNMSFFGVIFGEIWGFDLTDCDAETVRMVENLKEQSLKLRQDLALGQWFGILSGPTPLGPRVLNLISGLRELYAHVLPDSLEDFDYAFSR